MTQLVKKSAEKRKLTIRRAAVAGAVLSVACHLLPHDYRAACAAITKLASVSCGG